jgi:hypothetical protein
MNPSVPYFATRTYNYCDLEKTTEEIFFQNSQFLHSYLCEAEIRSILFRHASVRWGNDRLSFRQIIEIVQRSKESAWRPQWPTRNNDQRETIFAQSDKLKDLCEASPIRTWEKRSKVNQVRAYELIELLFAEDEVLYVQPASGLGRTAPRLSWSDTIDIRDLMVPNPMKEEEWLMECIESVHDFKNLRRFLVVKFTEPVIDHNAALVLYLKEKARLVCVCDSGTKQFEGPLDSWFYVGNKSEQEVFEFLWQAASLGAAIDTWNPAKLVAVPGGGRRSVYYFDALGVPMFDKEFQTNKPCV